MCPCLLISTRRIPVKSWGDICDPTMVNLNWLYKATFHLGPQVSTRFTYPEKNLNTSSLDWPETKRNICSSQARYVHTCGALKMGFFFFFPFLFVTWECMLILVCCVQPVLVLLNLSGVNGIQLWVKHAQSQKVILSAQLGRAFCIQHLRQLCSRQQVDTNDGHS